MQIQSLNRPVRLNPSLSSSEVGATVELTDSFLQGTIDGESSSESTFHQLGQQFRWKKPRSDFDEAQQIQGPEISSDFPDRNGYDKAFLGKALELPKIDPSRLDQVATLIGKPNESELTYTNFSVVMNKERRQPFYAAVNIDGAKIVDLPRSGKWTTDSRIPREHQLGNEAYKNNPFDRGHMVRRRDPVWGPDAAQANQDSFAYTNAGLQHGDLNQRSWLEMENYILEQAKAKDQKLTVITGPVFADDDPNFDNNGRMDKSTQLPQEFWKVVVWNDPEEGLKGAAFIQSQKDYLSNSLFKTDFEPDGLSLYQVPLKKLEETARLDFGPLLDSTSQAKRLEKGETPQLF